MRLSPLRGCRPQCGSGLFNGCVLACPCCQQCESAARSLLAAVADHGPCSYPVMAVAPVHWLFLLWLLYQAGSPARPQPAACPAAVWSSRHAPESSSSSSSGQCVLTCDDMLHLQAAAATTSFHSCSRASSPARASHTCCISTLCLRQSVADAGRPVDAQYKGAQSLLK